MADPYTHGDRYRMPVVFGPTPGPRQRPDGRRFDGSRARRSVTTVSFLTEAASLAELLPPGCALDGDPVVTVEHAELHALEWLAGRGYSLLGIKFPVRYQSPAETARGPFLAVLWENRCEPILSGREELGFAKLYAELPPARTAGDTQTCEACWDGHTFLRLRVDDLITAEPLAAGGADGVLHHRYLPPIGRSPAVEEMVISPAGAGTRFLSVRQGRGTVEFVRSSWEQLPTMFHIVNRLADLPVLEMRLGSHAATEGASDLADQRSLR